MNYTQLQKIIKEQSDHQKEIRDNENWIKAQLELNIGILQ